MGLHRIVSLHLILSYTQSTSRPFVSPQMRRSVQSTLSTLVVILYLLIPCLCIASKGPGHINSLPSHVGPGTNALVRLCFALM